jgi:hypothetical protein
MSKTQVKKKLSRREREERQQMRRMLLWGGGALGLATLAGVGVTFMDPVFPEMEGSETLADRLASSDLSRHVLDLTPGVESTDIVVVGTTDCSFCRDFAAEGAAEIASYARERGMGVVYAATGGSSASLASTRLLSCFARGSTAAPIETLQAVYAAGEEVGRGDDVAEVAARHGSALGLSQRDIEACLGADQMEISRRIQATSRAFPVQGTPMFFVATRSDPTVINMFSGYPGVAGLKRQIDAARGS